MPGLAGEARRHDDDVGAGGVGVVVRADDAGVVADDRRRLGEVEALALGQALDDVDEDDVGEAGLGDPLGGGGADVAGADDGDLVAGHGSRCSFRSVRRVVVRGRGWRLRSSCAPRTDAMVDTVAWRRSPIDRSLTHMPVLLALVGIL